MRRLTSYLALLLLLAGACQSDGGKKDAAPGPQTVDEYTQAIIREVQQVILSTDRQLRAYPPQEVEVAAEDGPAPLRLQLWKEEGNPVRLMATKPESGGPGAEVSTFYFANGKLFFATRPGAQFIFIDEQAKYRLDDNWKLAPAPEAEQQAEQQLLLEQAEQYLAAFEEE